MDPLVTKLHSSTLTKRTKRQTRSDKRQTRSDSRAVLDWQQLPRWFAEKIVPVFRYLGDYWKKMVGRWGGGGVNLLRFCGFLQSSVSDLSEATLFFLAMLPLFWC